jgi:hypothetical protein
VAGSAAVSGWTKIWSHWWMELAFAASRAPAAAEIAGTQPPLIGPIDRSDFPTRQIVKELPHVAHRVISFPRSAWERTSRRSASTTFRDSGTRWANSPNDDQRRTEVTAEFAEQRRDKKWETERFSSSTLGEHDVQLVGDCCSVPFSPSFFNREGLFPIVRGWPLNREGVARTPHDWKTPTFLPIVRPSFQW